MLHDELVDIVGIQEGRLRSSLRSGGHYIMYIGDPDAMGSYGCQVWLAKTLLHKLVSARSISPRIMLVHLIALSKNQEVVVLSAHAPIESDLPASKDAFWHLLACTIRDSTLKCPMASIVLCIDANARVGSIASASIGGCQPEDQNDNGDRFKELMESQQLWAVNTFNNAGKTWRSTHGTWLRIDYVCLKLYDAADTDKSTTDSKIDLSTSGRTDHLAVIVEANLVAKPVKVDRKNVKFVVNRMNLQDPTKVQEFRQLLSKARFEQTDDVNEMLEKRIQAFRIAALSVFGKPADQPRKTWISANTWSLLRLAAPFRRAVHKLSPDSSGYWVSKAWLAWRSLLHSSFMPDEVPCGDASQSGWVHYKGWKALAEITGLRRRYFISSLVSVCAFRCLQKLKWATNGMVGEDRSKHLVTLAVQANGAMLSNDTATGFRVARQLAGAKPKPLPCVKLANGDISSSETQRKERWQEYFAQMFKGRIHQSMSDLIMDDVEPVGGNFHTTVESDMAAYKALPCNKSTGTDEIPAEVLVAGGEPLAHIMRPVHEKIEEQCQMPIRWKGGRIADLYKQKGDPQLCSNSRGLLVSDHLAKGYIGQLKDNVDEQYCRNMPESQFGAVKNGGTDYAHHLVLTSIDYARLAAQSIFILFLDLEKAYDRIIRELVIGWPQDVRAGGRAYLESLGLHPDTVEWILGYISKVGPVFHQWGIDEKVIALINSLHTHSWFCYDDLETVISTYTGGRQGCKLGGTMFNSVYAQALLMCRELLKSEGIVLTVKASSSFWATDHNESGPGHHDILDATFVDDQCVILVASSPECLDRAIKILLRVIVNVFSVFALDINWGRGKTEALLQYRGKDSTAHMEALRQEDGSLAFNDPGGAKGRKLYIVKKYKHLGSLTSLGTSNMHDAIHRASSASAAYGPLASKIFGSKSVYIAIKCWFLQSLIITRLIFNVHLWVCRPPELAKLNGPYMRALRRISGCVRCSSTHLETGEKNKTDLEVRVMVGAQSIDSLIVQARLQYACRLANNDKAAPLKSLLASKPGGKHMPWAVQLASDMQYMYDNSTIGNLVKPAGHTDSMCTWLHVMKHERAEFQACLNEMSFVGSCLDSDVQVSEDGSILSPLPGQSIFSCMQCAPPVSFFSSKALQSHCRIKHGARSSVPQYINDSGVCPVCSTVFGSRLRVISHLSDTRRPKCRERVLAGDFPVLPRSVLAKLSVRDRELKRLALREGHTHTLASGAAVNAKGHIVGRV